MLNTEIKCIHAGNVEKYFIFFSPERYLRSTFVRDTKVDFIRSTWKIVSLFSCLSQAESSS